MGYEYGNARVASMRGRLLDDATLSRLAESATLATLVAQLERAEDWAAIMRQVASAGADAATALDTAIEVHRAARWGVLPGYYDGRARRLVEALVLPLDGERLLAVLRRRRAGEAPEHVASSVLPGALLDAHALARVARASDPMTALLPLLERGVLAGDDVRMLAKAEVSGVSTPDLEAMLTAALDRSRTERAAGRGGDAAAVRALLEREVADREAVVAEFGAAGPSLATFLERTVRLARLSGLAALGRRDPLGIGTAAGYVAAVEVQGIRLRAMAARVRAGWSAEDAAPYLSAAERPAWHASSS